VELAQEPEPHKDCLSSVGGRQAVRVLAVNGRLGPGRGRSLTRVGPLERKGRSPTSRSSRNGSNGVEAINFIEQLTAVTLLIDFFFGVTCGVIGSAVHGSRREDRGYTLLGAAPDPVSAGARVLHGIYTSADEYMLGLLPGGGEADGYNCGIGDFGVLGQELDQ
jgi:hypothetical protein